jgi:starvation-inducible outer membrane lipoprotein
MNSRHEQLTIAAAALLLAAGLVFAGLVWTVPAVASDALQKAEARASALAKKQARIAGKIAAAQQRNNDALHEKLLARQASHAGDSHPHVLPEPYVSLSTHTAPSAQPFG